jgi:hypothetical protein
MSVEAFFSDTYAQARAKFLAAAEAAGLDLHEHRHPMLGREGEALAMDVARDGPADAANLLIVSSACHGVEGYGGSGAQVALLRDAAFHRAARDARVAVLYIHALNPYGFSWGRRVTHENVDLNRNFVDFSKPLPANAGYEELVPLLLPTVWPPSPENQAAVASFIATRGMDALQTAVSSGQYTHPEGLFHGGVNPTWSQVRLRQVLRDEASRAKHIGWIDLHTGLGPSGFGELILAARDDAETRGRARSWWGEAVTSTEDGSSTSALLTGEMWTVVYDECPQAEYTGVTLEYGTVPLMEMIEALRAEQWLENHPEAPLELAARIKAQMRAAFFTDTSVWKARVAEQAVAAAIAAVRGLAA